MSCVNVARLKLVSKTEKAYGVSQNGGEVKWIPSSQVENLELSRERGDGWIEIPKWLAEKNELDYEE